MQSTLEQKDYLVPPANELKGEICGSQDVGTNSTKVQDFQIQIDSPIFLFT